MLGRAVPCLLPVDAPPRDRVAAPAGQPDPGGSNSGAVVRMVRDADAGLPPRGASPRNRTARSSGSTRLEARFPPLALFGARSYGPVPLELGAFFLIGFAVLELDWAKPLDRPDKGAFFQFNLLTGF